MIRRLSATVALALLGALAIPQLAVAEVTKFYDPALSLTGDCSASKVDPVLDPGCPGGVHPPESLSWPYAVTTDRYGDVYLVDKRAQLNSGNASIIYIFGPSGEYLAGFSRPGARMIAVDTAGRLYVSFGEPVVGGARGLLRYDPTVYNPAAGEIEYSSPPVSVSPNGDGIGTGLEVDPSDNHLYYTTGSFGSTIYEYAPPVAGLPNAVVHEIDLGLGSRWTGQIAVDGVRDRIFINEAANVSQPTKVKAFELHPPYHPLMTIEKAGTTPFASDPRLPIEVDEKNGHLFVVDYETNRYAEYGADGSYLGLLQKPPTLEGMFHWIAVDDSPESPNEGYLYMPSGEGSGHLFAYEPASEPEPPLVEALSVAGVTEREAILLATVNPKSEPAHWTIEFTSEQRFQEEGGSFAGAEVAAEGTISAGNRGVKVSAALSGLVPGTAYRFRVRAENQCEPGGCVAEEDAAFATFAPPPAQNGSCPNQALRTGASAALPDCRAYELVTPADTAGLIPLSPNNGSAGPRFVTPNSSPAGDNLAFTIQGGLIPGFDGNGTLYGDTYTSARGPAGWGTTALGPSGAQATLANPGGLSADHSHFVFDAEEQGSLVIDRLTTEYVRYPDGSMHLAGQGSLASDPEVGTNFIAPGGAHVIFSTGVGERTPPQLEPNGPPEGTAGIYDRTGDGVLHVVSLLPGDVTPGAGERAIFVDASKDGSAVAFRLKLETGPIYLRVDDEETLTAAPAGVDYAGLSADGRYLFYTEADDLYRFDSQTGETEPVTTSGDAVPVIVGSQGSGGYFLSPSVLGGAPNPLGAEPQAGAQNLYHWDAGGIDFVATVTNRDAEGVFASGIDHFIDGLGVWVEMFAGGGLSQIALASRTSADATALAFESRANLTGFDSGGKAEIYRYDAAAETLQCLSCDPTGAMPGGDASLSPPFGTNQIFSRLTEIATMTADGRRAFFETPERLVPADNDGKIDVYEWETEGEGTCAEPGGCLFLISSGQSARDNRIFGVSDSGDDVFVWTSDLLGGGDDDETPSVYDARVGGGFAPPVPPSAECLGEACQPAAAAPDDPSPENSETAGNVSPPQTKRCPKGKRKVNRGGKVRCIRPHGHRRKNGKKPAAGAGRRAHR